MFFLGSKSICFFGDTPFFDRRKEICTSDQFKIKWFATNLPNAGSLSFTLIAHFVLVDPRKKS